MEYWDLELEHEEALNEDNLAYQEVLDAWNVDAFRDAKLGSKKGKMNAASYPEMVLKIRHLRDRHIHTQLYSTARSLELLPKPCRGTVPP